MQVRTGKKNIKLPKGLTKMFLPMALKLPDSIKEGNLFFFLTLILFMQKNFE